MKKNSKLSKKLIKMLEGYYCYDTALERVGMSSTESMLWLEKTIERYKKLIGIKEMRKIDRLARELGW